MDQKQLEQIVRLVTEQVKARLGELDKNASNCTAGKADCKGCGDCASRRPGDVQNILSLGAVRIASAPNVSPMGNDLARYIDHTLLKPEATREELNKLCEEAKQFNFYSVCVNSSNVAYCKSLLRGSSVKVVAVVGFPLGAMSASSKAFETREAVKAGAEEIDTVLNIGAMKSKDYDTVLDDLRKTCEAARPKPVKVILETSKLTLEEKIIACALSKTAGAHFVKTSTGFGGGGATADDVRLMKAVVGDEMEVKASGGVNSTEKAQEMIAAGATRIGASASVAIVQGKVSKSTY
jgi:deoxyribose-phosphate aldolase